MRTRLSADREGELSKPDERTFGGDMMNGLIQLSELARLLKTIAKMARYVAPYQKRRAAEIFWIAHQIEELADELGNLGGLPRNAIVVAAQEHGAS